MRAPKYVFRLLPALILWLAVRPLGAQSPLDVPVGARIRVLPRGEGSWKVGELAGIQPDTIAVQLCQNAARQHPRDGDTVIHAHMTLMGDSVYWVRDCHPNRYALKSLDRMEVSKGRNHSLARAGWGLVFGGMIGFTASYIVAYNDVKHCAPNDDMCGLIWIIVPPSALAGLVTGGIIGAVTTGETWQPVRYP